MSRYRKLDPRFWKDEKIRHLSQIEKLISLYAFTGQSNRIGLFSFSPGEAVEDLGLSRQTFAKGFGKVCKILSLGGDSEARVLYLPTWWKYNHPENPNVLKSILTDLHELPQTPLITEFSSNLRYLSETFHQTFREGLGKPSPKRMPHQEQQQEQEQEQEIGEEASPNSSSPIVEKTIRRLNELAGTSFRPDSKVTVKHINARISEGYTLEDFEAVLESKWHEWRDNSDMRKFYRPQTLFSPEHFEGYLQAAKLNGNGNGHAPVIEELEGDMVKVDGVTMDRKTYELRYGRTN